jgi:hypothetical protein
MALISIVESLYHIEAMDGMNWWRCQLYNIGGDFKTHFITILERIDCASYRVLASAPQYWWRLQNSSGSKNEIRMHRNKL